MKGNGDLLKHLVQSDNQILEKRSGQFVSRLDQECYTRFLTAKAELEDRLMKRETLLDFGRKTSQDLTLSVPLSEVQNLSGQLMEINNEIHLMWMSLNYQKTVMENLFGKSDKYELPNIDKVI